MGLGVQDSQQYFTALHFFANSGNSSVPGLGASFGPGPYPTTSGAVSLCSSPCSLSPVFSSCSFLHRQAHTKVFVVLPAKNSIFAGRQLLFLSKFARRSNHCHFLIRFRRWSLPRGDSAPLRSGAIPKAETLRRMILRASGPDSSKQRPSPRPYPRFHPQRYPKYCFTRDNLVNTRWMNCAAYLLDSQCCARGPKRRKAHRDIPK